MLSSSFEFLPEYIEMYKRDGFVRLPGFFSIDFVNYVKEKIQNQMTTLDKEQTSFNKIGYDIFEEDQNVFNLIQSKIFQFIMKELTGHELFFSQAIGFEIEKEKHTGFPWHIGTQSFGYHQGNDFGCSIWTPLIPIKYEKQGGGMSYVSESKLSGKFMYDFIDPAIDRLLEAYEESGPNQLSMDEFAIIRHGALNSPAMDHLLDFHKQVDNFELGDVLLFNKNIIHASEPLQDGPITARCAFVMRFIDVMSTYDQKRAEGLEFPRKYFGNPQKSNFHMDVCKSDGEKICQSNFFKNPELRFLNTHL